MIPRNIEDELKETAKEFPVITITGPRQSGKTTLAKKIFGHYSYCQ
jgi:predicted AAA+ superfamily ATPase